MNLVPDTYYLHVLIICTKKSSLYLELPMYNQWEGCVSHSENSVLDNVAGDYSYKPLMSVVSGEPVSPSLSWSRKVHSISDSSRSESEYLDISSYSNWWRLGMAKFTWIPISFISGDIWVILFCCSCAFISTCIIHMYHRFEVEYKVSTEFK